MYRTPFPFSFPFSLPPPSSAVVAVVVVVVVEAPPPPATSACVRPYSPVKRALWPLPSSGNVISTVLADGRRAYGAVDVEDGSKVKGMEDGSRDGWRVVVAWVRRWDVRRGRMNWVDQPAPRMRRSRGLGDWGGGGDKGRGGAVEDGGGFFVIVLVEGWAGFFFLVLVEGWRWMGSEVQV